MVDTYDPKQVNISFGGKSIKAGIADGTFVTASRNVRTRTFRPGGDGGGTIVVATDKSVALSITYLAGSETNDKLEDMRKSDDAGVFKVGTLNIEYFDGGSGVSDENAFIDGPPELTFEGGESTRTWTFICPSGKITTRGTGSPERIGSV